MILTNKELQEAIKYTNDQLYTRSEDYPLKVHREHLLEEQRRRAISIPEVIIL